MIQRSVEGFRPMRPQVFVGLNQSDRVGSVFFGKKKALSSESSGLQKSMYDAFSRVDVQRIQLYRSPGPALAWWLVIDYVCVDVSSLNPKLIKKGRFRNLFSVEISAIYFTLLAPSIIYKPLSKTFLSWGVV